MIAITDQRSEIGVIPVFFPAFEAPKQGENVSNPRGRIIKTETEFLEAITDVVEKIDGDKHYGQQGDRINQNLQEKLEDGLAEVGK